MVLTQTDIDNLSAQYKTLKALAKSDFVAAVNAAKVPADLDIPKQTFHKALDDLEDLNDFINSEQELVDASTDGSDASDDDTTDSEADDSGDAAAKSEPIVGPGTTSPTNDPTPAAAETATPETAPAAATSPAPVVQDVINTATQVVQNNPALLQDIVNVATTVKDNPELLTKVATALTAPNGDQNLITQGLVEVKNLLAATPK
jgi:hypothetical protein